MTAKYLIGLTGNIATGKSAAAHMLRALGANVIDADQTARTVVQPNTPTLAKIIGEFGNGVLFANSELNRKALGEIVFNDPAKLRVLENIMQPAIRALLQTQLDELPTDHVGVLEAIRLFEGGWHSQCHETWVTVCPPEMQVARLVAHRKLSEAEAWVRVRAQHAAQEKAQRADVVIDTATTLEETQVQVMREWVRVCNSTYN